MYMITQGGPRTATMTLVYNIYNVAFVNTPKYGYASAIAMVLFVLVLIVTIIQFRAPRARTEKGGRNHGNRCYQRPRFPEAPQFHLQVPDLFLPHRHHSLYAAALLWMLSSSFKLNKDVFGFPIQWIPKNPRWQNYVDIWTQIPLLTFVKNTVKITLVVTLLQLFTSSFAAYAFAKMQFKGKNVAIPGLHRHHCSALAGLLVPQFMR